MIDIYGSMPDYVENLFHISNLKIQIKGKNVQFIKLLDDTVKIQFIDPNLINIKTIMDNINNDNLTIMKKNTIKYILHSESFKDKCREIIEIIKLAS